VSFALDPRLAADTWEVGDLALSRVLLMNDARYPWVILVPRRAGLVELLDLDPAARASLMEEAAAVARVLQAEPGVEKINLGALGNIVRQLHLHVIGRRAGDAAWPGPVWGQGRAEPYEAAAGAALAARLGVAVGAISRSR
jgi:diadenosine tetraphosphate (Ap4A) HIT family hydrolase